MAETNNKRTEGLRAYWGGDYVEAYRLLLPLAESGDAEIQCALGTMYHLGLGFPPDGQLAEQWFLKSGLQGYALAYSNLAGMYVSGCADLDADLEQAKFYYRKAAEHSFEMIPDFAWENDR
jgi:TPR repeat protein